MIQLFKQLAGKARRNRSGATLTEWLVVLMAGALVLAIIISGLLQIMQRSEARQALANAKAARLAAFAISAQQQSSGAPFADNTRPDGLAKGVQEQILLLSKVPGDVEIAQTESDAYGVVRMIYNEYNYMVVYSATEETWRVYRQQTIIDAGGTQKSDAVPAS